MNLNKLMGRTKIAIDDLPHVEERSIEFTSLHCVVRFAVYGDIFLKDPSREVVIIRSEIRGENELLVEFDFIGMECCILTCDDKRAEEDDNFHVDDFNGINVCGFCGEVENHVEDACEVEHSLNVELRYVSPETEVPHEDSLSIKRDYR